VTSLAAERSQTARLTGFNRWLEHDYQRKLELPAGVPSKGYKPIDAAQPSCGAFQSPSRMEALRILCRAFDGAPRRRGILQPFDIFLSDQEGLVNLLNGDFF
jgi:hypothetical protein